MTTTREAPARVPAQPAPAVAVPGAPHSVQRADIQALRGLAVLLVLLYHVKLGRVHAGFLGVDIFFVISGFLITTLVGSGIRRGTFSFADFYARRAKRLLPAAYVTYLATALAAPLFLTQRELQDLAAQLFGALTFSGNFVLWRQTGYFEGAAELKPLLHMWSLAVEEQYYFLLPGLLVLARPRWLLTTAALFAASLLAYVAGAFDPAATFYLLPTRAWELLTGSLGALWVLAGRPQAAAATRGLRLFFAPALACLVVVPFLRLGDAAARWGTLAVCVATLAVILRQHETLGASRPVRALARVGDFSYSLYLVHWPVVAFVNNAWVGNPTNPEVQPRPLRLVALALSLGLAYALYRTVEDPLRRANLGGARRVWLAAAGASVLVGAVTPVALRRARRTTDFAYLVRKNFGLSPACEYTERFAPKPECVTSARPDVLVWGDSYAMHLVPGLAKEWDGRGLMQATRSRCAPILGVASILTGPAPAAAPRDDEAWARRCIDFNRAVVEHLRRDSAVRYVVLSSPFNLHVSAGAGLYTQLVSDGSAFRAQPAATGTAVAALRRTVDTVRALGRKVVIVAPPPSSGRDYSECVERRITRKLTFGPFAGCTFDQGDYLRGRGPVLELLQAVSEAADVRVIRFDPWLCDGRSCVTTLGGTPVYRDEGHLSYAGSELLARRMGLARLVREQAR